MEEDGLSSDAVYMESAWEQAAASRGRANGGSDVPRVSPPETLDLRVFCGTWNVAGRMLEDGDDTTIAEWLDLDVNFSQDSQDEDKPEPPDIFVIGLQEVVDLSAHNVVMDSLLDTQSRSNTLKWFTAIYAFLTQYGQRYGLRYVMLAEQRLLGTYILVMASTVVCPKLGQVQSTAIPTGLGGWLGNKGAVAVHVDVGGSASLCFVCVHMASHRENLEVRNAEYKQIVSRPVFFEAAGGGRITRHASFGSPTRERRQSGWGTLFAGGVSQANANAAGLSPTRAAEMKKALKAVLALGPKAGEARVRSGTPPGQGPQAAEGISRHSNTISGDSFHRVSDGGSTHGAGVDYLPKTKTVLQADIVFWIGDLNYRIVEDVPDSKVFEMLERDDLEKLRALDQLNVERAARRAFGEFQEGPLCFVPSYKYIPGTRKYDQRPEKKARCPSWCDRVLYSVGNYGGNSVRRLALDNYWSEGPLFSDHMPVNALFRTSIRCAAEEAISEREIEAEPISPRRAQAAAAFVSAPFARIEVDPATLVLTLRKGVKWLIAVIVVSNTGGVRGSFHLTGESRPAWLKWEGTGRGSLSPGERAELRLSIDVEAAEEVASRSSAGVAESAEARDATLSACAVLRIEADGGGSGVLLPVTCTFAEI